MNAMIMLLNDRKIERERKVQESKIFQEVYNDILKDGYNHGEAVEILFQYKDCILDGIC